MDPESKKRRHLPLSFVASIGIALIVVLIVWMNRESSYPETRRILKQLLDEGEIEFLTIEPYTSSLDGKELGQIAGYPILDKVKLDDPEVLKVLLTDMVYEREPDELPDCFVPHHAVRSIKSPNVFMLVCFQCHIISGSSGGMAQMSANARDVAAAAYDEVVEEYNMKISESLE